MTNYEKIKSLSYYDMAQFLANIHDELICHAACQFGKKGEEYDDDRFAYVFSDFVGWLDEPYDWTDDAWSSLVEDSLPMNNAERLQLMTPHDLAGEIWKIAQQIKLLEIKDASSLEYYLKQEATND